jgi:hypothetical protein
MVAHEVDRRRLEGLEIHGGSGEGRALVAVVATLCKGGGAGTAVMDRFTAFDLPRRARLR